MRIETGHICKNCCYFSIDDGDIEGYCCLEPLFTAKAPNTIACMSYASDDDVMCVNNYKIQDDEDDKDDDLYLR